MEWNTDYDPTDIERDRVFTGTRWTLVGGGRIDPIATVRDTGTGTLVRVGGQVDYATGTIIFKPETTIGMPRPRWATAEIGSERATSPGWTGVRTTFHTSFSGIDYIPIPATFVEGLEAYVEVRYRTTSAGNAATQSFSFTPGADLTPGYAEPLVPGSILLQVGSTLYVDRQGTLYSAIDRTTGAGVASGTVNYSTGTATFTVWPEGETNSGTVRSLLTSLARMPVDGVTFRTAAAPLRPGSFIVQFVALDDEDQQTVTVTAHTDGTLTGTRVAGQVDAATGVIALRFGEFVSAAGNESEPWYHPPAVLDDGTIWRPRMVFSDTIRYAAVAYSYLPLDANILGLDPVRLPQDGRVPIFRPGDFAVVGHTGKLGPVTVANGQTINCTRVRLSRIRVVGDDGVVIPTGFTTDLDAGTLSFTDVTGYSQPVTIEHRIEDLVQVSDVQISGQLAFTRALTHDYPAGSFVSSALVAGDLRARVSLVFDQQTWTGTWADAATGSVATATFNDVLHPITVTNAGAVTERWAIRFTNTTSFEVIGEHVGVIAIGSTSTDLAPINPAAGVPYFSLPAMGWGLGWATGNVLRFNTIGALTPAWIVRTIAQGPETVTDDAFTLLIRGDVDRP